jgi:hypothetical protein
LQARGSGLAIYENCGHGGVHTGQVSACNLPWPGRFIWQGKNGDLHDCLNQSFAPDEDISKPVTNFGPDFPFAFDDWIKHPAGLGSVRPIAYGEEVAIIGAGMAGMTAAFELLKMGLSRGL